MTDFIIILLILTPFICIWVINKYFLPKKKKTQIETEIDDEVPINWEIGDRIEYYIYRDTLVSISPDRKEFISEWMDNKKIHKYKNNYFHNISAENRRLNILVNNWKDYNDEFTKLHKELKEKYLN